MLILTLIGVACLLRAPCAADQSESDDSNVRERPVDTPEVVLQLKYDGGELNRIYLTQFRKESKTVTASVPSRSGLCLDLCFAGLGGRPCGRSCPKMLPVGLKMALASDNSTETPYGFPRVSVCPILCENNLGEPLCSCSREELDRPVDWLSVCGVFCDTDHHVLGGCPACEESSTARTTQVVKARILTTTDGWQSWCNVQCRQGQGGAACNCDRAPFQ